MAERAGRQPATLYERLGRISFVKPRFPPLLVEMAYASLAMAGLGLVVALLYWLLTGLSPWPGLVLGEVAGFGFGTALLALSSPRRHL